MGQSSENPAGTQPPDQDANTRPTEPLPGESNVSPIFRHLADGLTVAPATHVGLKRRRNEDSYWVMNTELCSEGGTRPLALLIVADGLGGHENGDAASSTAARVVASYVAREFMVPFLIDQTRTHVLPPIVEVLRRSVEAANVLIHEKLPNAGTTLTAALLLENRIYLAHVGDSRAYLFDTAGLRQITRDHSLSAQMRAQAEAFPNTGLPRVNRNILYNAVGQGTGMEVDTHLLDLPPAGGLLLCSDGLWDRVSDEEIHHVLCISPTPRTAVHQLIAEANQRGGDDNITALLAIRAPDRKPTSGDANA